MNIYPNGIQDLINEEKPKENEPQIILLFNTPSWFNKKYNKKEPLDNNKSKLNLNFIKEIGDLIRFNIIKDKKNILFEEEDDESNKGLLRELKDIIQTEEEKKEDDIVIYLVLPPFLFKYLW